MFVRSGWRSERSSLSGADQSRHNLVSGGPGHPNHDAAMRIGSEAPKRRTHSFPRHNSHGANRDPPPRIVIGDPSQADELGRNCWVPSATSVYCVGRRTTPSGTTPSRTSRHKAIKSLRAKADHELARTARVLGAGSKPLRQGAVLLKHEKSPRQLDHASPNSSASTSTINPKQNHSDSLARQAML